MKRSGQEAFVSLFRQNGEGLALCGFCEKRGLHAFCQRKKLLIMISGSDIVKQQVFRAENAVYKTVQLFLQIILSAFKVLLQIIHQTVKGHAA